MSENTKLISDKTRETTEYKIRVITKETDCWCCNYEHRTHCLMCNRGYESEKTPPCRRCKGKGRRRFTNSTKEQKFLCIGGVLNDRSETESFAGIDYVPYNRASRYSAGRSPKVVLIHKSLL
jgi:hypothetical protein